MKRLYVLSFLILFSLFLSAQDAPKTLTPEQKLVGLSTLWSEAKYNAAFFDNIGEAKWDSIYRTLIRPVMESPNDYEYYRLLKRYCAMLRDGHSGLWHSSAPIITTYFDKFQWYLTNIEGKAIITSISSRQKDSIPVGSEIVEVNGMPTAEYVKKEVLPYICASTDYVRMDYAIGQMFQSLRGTSYQVKIATPAGKVLDMKITHKIPPEVRNDPMYPEQGRKLLHMKWYPGNIAYLQLNSFGNPKIVEEFKAVFPELKKKARKLIIDLRENRGGSTTIGADILAYLTPDSCLVGSAWQTRVHNPAYRSWGGSYTPEDTIGNEFATKAYRIAHREYYEVATPYTVSIPQDQERLVVPTVLLIGHNTASAAEDFLILADRQKHMVKIGQNSNGSTGNPIFYELEGNISLQICSKKDTYPDGRPFVGCGVKPDIEIVPTVVDFRNGYDRALEKAVVYLKKRK